MAPRRSAKAARIATGAERRRKKRLEEGALRDLQSACYLDDLTVEGSIEKSLEGHIIKIDLADCNICALPNSIGQLKALTKLDLFNCKNITRLPEGIGGLTALETLTLDHCFALAALPAAIGELESLTELNLNLCESLVALPDSIGGLAALETLILYGCQKLVALPKRIGDLKSLTVLCLDECSSLTELPDTIGGLGALTELNLCRCPITALPDAIGELKALTELNLAGCKSLTSLPDTIDGLTALKELGLEGCKSLAALPPAIDAMHWLEVKGGPRSGLACFMELARPRVKAAFPERTDDSIDAMLSHYWSSSSESRRAKVDDTHDGIVYGESMVSNLIKALRKVRRRTCDACGRQGRIEEDRFPVCWCGARRYCGEECQKADWAAGHAQTCASGHTWSGKDLLWFRSLEKQRAEAERNLEYLRSLNQGQPGFIQNVDRYLTKNEQMRQELIARNPPPADRER